MSKIALTSLGAAGVASSVPLMHLLGKRYAGQSEKEMGVNLSTMVLFLVGWGMLAAGLSKPPKGTESTVDDRWKKRQMSLSVVGTVLVLIGVAAVRYKHKLRFPTLVGASAFVAGWGVLTAAFIHADPDYDDNMGSEEKAGRVLQSLVSTLMIISGAALISMSDQSAQLGKGTAGYGGQNRWSWVDVNRVKESTVPLSAVALEGTAVATFLLGWANAVAVSALQ